MLIMRQMNRTPYSEHLRTKNLKIWTEHHIQYIVLFIIYLTSSIMADLLTSRTPQLPFSQEHLALLFAQHASSETVINRKNEAFKKVVDELQQTREDAERNFEKAKYLELDVTRTDAQLARTREALTKAQRRAAELQKELDKSKKCEICDHQSGVSRDGESSSHPTGAIKKAQRWLQEIDEENSEQREITTSNQVHDEIQDYQTNREHVRGVSYEEHEIVIRQAMLMKQELTRLAKNNGTDVEKILDAAEYNKIIKMLQRDIQEKADQNEILYERIEDLCSKDDGAWSQVTELQFKNDKLLKKLNISQVMIDTLSKRCEELKDDVELSRQQEGHPVDDSKVFVPIKKEETTLSPIKDNAAQGNDQTDSHLLSAEIKQYEHQKKRQEEEIRLLDIQLKQVIVDNKQLFKECREAEKQREIYEQRYNKLMETLQDVQQRQRQCSNCRSLEQELAKLRVEVTDLKEVNELVTAQMKLYEEDLRQEQVDMANLKQKNNFHIEQWKKNCQRMGQQVDLLMSDLKKERQSKQALQLQLNHLKNQRSSVSMAPNFDVKQSPRCTPRAPVSTPWQAGFNSGFSQDVVVDGAGVDECDGSDSSGRYQSAHGSLSLAQKPFECPRCKREYPSEKVDEYHKHVSKCFDSS